MTVTEIRALFNELNQKLERAGLTGEILICGGALMAIAYNKERITEDIDALYTPKKEFEEIILQIAHTHNLPDNWLNDTVSQSINMSDFESETIIELSSLRVKAVVLEVLLTMKLMACRDKDSDDIKLLVARMGNFDLDEVMNLVLKYVPSHRLIYASGFLKALFERVSEKDMALLHYRQFHQDEYLINALSEFAINYTFPKCHPIEKVLEMKCDTEQMEHSQAYVRYLFDESKNNKVRSDAKDKI